VEGVQNFIKNLFIKERTSVQKSKHSRHDLQWKFHILASCVDLLVWSAKDDSGLKIQFSTKFETFLIQRATFFFSITHNFNSIIHIA
jgi:hypothetical protein